MPNSSYNRPNTAIKCGERKPYADTADIANLNDAIVALNNAKKATNSTFYVQQLRKANMLCKSLWNKENGI